MAAADPSTLRLATRGSALALRQTALAAHALGAAGSGDLETVVVRTEGDRRTDAPIDQLEGQGWFTADLERTLLDGRADVAVHSAKDLPSALAPGLSISAYLPRADARDGVVSASGRPLGELPPGATVGTSSARRAGLLEALYPGLRAVPMRGNVDTRLRKLDAGDVDALLLACAGLDRLSLGDRVTQRLDPVVFVPSPAQGAIALETLTGSAAARACALAGDTATSVAVTAERAVLIGLGGGCLLPLGAWGRIENGRLVLTAALVVGGAVRRAEASGSLEAPEGLGDLVAARLR
ncbi:MAG TPA: hydroxymethylbilane synthase [Candidatus Saccharimonadales bacterium]|nr:hydroxymethylbilane synthase [Candidatus Saccharimonadales bacterium]